MKATTATATMTGVVNSEDRLSDTLLEEFIKNSLFIDTLLFAIFEAYSSEKRKPEGSRLRLKLG